jgi:hypothetical protein
MSCGLVVWKKEFVSCCFIDWSKLQYNGKIGTGRVGILAQELVYYILKVNYTI